MWTKPHLHFHLQAGFVVFPYTGSGHVRTIKWQHFMAFYFTCTQGTWICQFIVICPIYTVPFNINLSNTCWILLGNWVSRGIIWGIKYVMWGPPGIRKDKRYYTQNNATQLTLKRFEIPYASTLCLQWHFVDMNRASPKPHDIRLNELPLHHRNAVNYSCCNFAREHRLKHNAIVCHSRHSNNAPLSA